MEHVLVRVKQMSRLRLLGTHRYVHTQTASDTWRTLYRPHRPSVHISHCRHRQTAAESAALGVQLPTTTTTTTHSSSLLLNRVRSFTSSARTSCTMCVNGMMHMHAAAPGQGVGGPTTSKAPSTREVLPSNVKPTNYKIVLEPNFDSFKFKGAVDISLEIAEDTTEVVANSLQLEYVDGGSYVAVTGVDGQERKIVPTEIKIDEKLERVTYVLPEKIAKAATKSLVLHSEFVGVHNDEMAGFYRSGYVGKDGKKEYMVVTQFEATDCRRALPSWDEPNHKCTFDITLKVDEKLTALSNMQVTSETSNGDGTKTVVFATTPKMSTYLVAFAVGEFEFIETVSKPKDSKPITCRVYTRKGQVEQGKFALEVCARTLEFFSEYFEIAYPLPKMDMIAVPDFSAGAMENWGLVTYRDVTLLYDEKNSSSTAKQHVAYVVGHELAHQWFGNLVTMDWWNELWLNEGFATFVGTMVVDHLYPEWKIWTQFITNDLANAMSLDALRSSHPIDVEVPRAADIKSIFDHVSYYKGASVIRMLNSYLGSEVFRKGVVAYLKKNQYSNATTKDLWAALSEVSGHDVSSFMHTWIKEMGFPVVRVTNEKYDEAKEELTLTLTQERYLSTNDLTTEERKTSPTWWIPIGVLTHGNSSEPVTKILSAKEGTITFPYKKAESSKQWWKLNFNTTGLYRIDLSDAQIKNIGRNINENPTQLAVEDRVGIINDTFELAKAGYEPLSNYLDLLKNFDKEEEYIVLGGIASGLSSIKTNWYRESPEVKEGISKLQLSIFAKKARELGFDSKPTDDHLTTFKRTLVLGVASAAGDKEIIAEFTDRFNKFIAGDESALNPNLRGAAYRTVLRTEEDDAKSELLFKKILEVFQNATTPDQKLTALGSLGAAKSHKVIEEALNKVALDVEVIRPQDGMYLPRSISTDNPDPQFARDLVWKFVTSNIVQLHDRYASSFSLLGHMVVSGFQTRVGQDVIAEVEQWSTAKAGELPGETKEQGEKRVATVELVSRPLAQSLERVKANTKWVERERESVAKWVAENTK